MSSTTNPSRNTTIIAVFFILVALAAGVRAINIFDYLSPSESPLSLQQYNSTVNGVTYTVVTIAGKDSMVLKGDAIVKTESEMGLALKSICFDTGYPTVSELSEINSNVLVFNDSRQSATSLGQRETFCDSIVGQGQGDEGGCVDVVSCQISCNQGSYACFQYAQGSAIFLPELLKYANTKRSIDSSVRNVLATTAELKGAQSASQVSFDVAEKLGTLSNHIAVLTNESANYATNKLFTRPMFEFCVPYGHAFSLNDTALSVASTRTSVLALKASCFGSLSAKTAELFNETFRRIDVYTQTRAKGGLQDQYDILMAQYNNLTETATGIAQVIDDQNIPTYISDVESLNSRYYTNLHSNETDQAGLTVSMLDSKIKDFDSYVDSLYQVFGPLVENRTLVTAQLNKADVIIEPTDAAMSADLKKLKDRSAYLDTKLTVKINAEEVSTYASSYGDLATEISALIDKKRQLESERVPGMLSGVMRSVSLSVLNAVASPLSVSESDKRAWITNVPLIVIILFDLVVLAFASIVFFFIVWRNASVIMKPKVMRTWGIISVVLLVLLIGISFALNAALNSEMGPTSLYSFMASVNAQPSVMLFVEHAAIDNTVNLNKCVSTIDGKLAAMGKTVTRVEVVDGICSDRLLSECLSQTGTTPVIRLKLAQKNSTTFYTFYKVEGAVEGDGKYFQSCFFGELME